MSTDGFPETRVTSSVTEAQILALKKEIEQLDSELKRLEERLSEATETSCHTKIDELEKKSSRVNRILGLVIVVSSSLTVWLMVRPGYPSTAEGVGGTDLRNCLVCLAAGVLGSTTSAFISALQRRSNGWEIHGIKIPPGTGERFNEKMVPFFLGRPLLGLLVGMLVFAASQGKLLFRVDCQDEPSPYRMVFYSLLTGLFAKSLIERLKAVFDKIFGA